MPKSMKNGLYVIFVLILGFVNYWLKWFGMYEYLIICIMAMVVIKLTDIEESIDNLP